MDVFHTVQHPLLLGGPLHGCEHKARPGSRRSLKALAARSLLRVQRFLQLERWVVRLLLSRGSMRRLPDTAADGAARSPAPVNGRRARHRVDLEEEQRAGSGAAPGRGGRRLLVSGGRRRWDGFGRGALGG